MHGSSTDVRPVYVQINFSNVNRAEGGKETRSDLIVTEIKHTINTTCIEIR